MGDELKPSEIEQIELTAGFFNAVASGVILAAFIVPFIGVALGTVQVTADMAGVASLFALGVTLAHSATLDCAKTLARIGPMTLEVLLVALWMIAVTAFLAVFAFFIQRSDAKRIARRRQQEHPAE